MPGTINHRTDEATTPPAAPRWIGDKQGRVWESAARDARCVCVMGDPAEPMTKADRENMRLILAAGQLLAAAEELTAGLDARIIAARAAGEPVPVFKGIGAMWAALRQARPATSPRAT